MQSPKPWWLCTWSEFGTRNTQALQTETNRVLSRVNALPWLVQHHEWATDVGLHAWLHRTPEDADSITGGGEHPAPATHSGAGTTSPPGSPRIPVAALLPPPPPSPHALTAVFLRLLPRGRVSFARWTHAYWLAVRDDVPDTAATTVAAATTVDVSSKCPYAVLSFATGATQADVTHWNIVLERGALNVDAPTGAVVVYRMMPSTELTSSHTANHVIGVAFVGVLDQGHWMMRAEFSCHAVWPVSVQHLRGHTGDWVDQMMPTMPPQSLDETKTSEEATVHDEPWAFAASQLSSVYELDPAEHTDDPGAWYLGVTRLSRFAAFATCIVPETTFWFQQADNDVCLTWHACSRSDNPLAAPSGRVAAVHVQWHQWNADEQAWRLQQWREVHHPAPSATSSTPETLDSKYTAAREVVVTPLCARRAWNETAFAGPDTAMPSTLSSSTADSAAPDVRFRLGPSPVSSIYSTSCTMHEVLATMCCELQIVLATRLRVPLLSHLQHQIQTPPTLQLAKVPPASTPPSTTTSTRFPFVLTEANLPSKYSRWVSINIVPPSDAQ